LSENIFVEQRFVLSGKSLEQLNNY